MDIGAVRDLWDAGEIDLAAQAIYDAMPVPLRPGWAADIAELSLSRLAVVQRPLRAVVKIGRSPRRYREGHAAFSAVRGLTLAEDEGHAGGELYLAVLITAEYAAKVIYNASGVTEPIKPGEKGLFDDECGSCLVGCLWHLALGCDDPEFRRKTWEVLESWLRRSGG